MKINFRKVSALASSALMLGMTAGIAAAANYPAPFVVGGSPNVAIVYGSGAAFSDQTAASSIAESLSGYAGGSVTVEGGEAFALTKDSDPFNFNENLSGVYTTLDSDEMTFLADGTYDDGDVDEDYEQSITLSHEGLNLFADTDYANDAPTVGFFWTNGENILNYTITFDDAVNTTQMVDTNLPLLGGEYYVLAASHTQIDVLDTAETHSLSVGETGTIAGKSITLTYVDSNSAKFTVDGEATDDLLENDEFKLADDSYIVVTDVSYQDYSGGVQAAEFAIGSGKIELIDGEEAELNTEDIDGLEVNLVNSSVGTMDSITLIWKSDRDTFLTEGSSIAIPELGDIGLAFGGLTMPESEVISVDHGDTLMLNMGNYDLPVMWLNTAATPGAQLMGEEDNVLELAANTTMTYGGLGFTANQSTIWWNAKQLLTVGVANNTHVMANTTINIAANGALNLSENDRFLVTRIDADLTDTETMYYEVATIDIDDGNTWTVELEDLIGANDLTFTDAINDTDEAGDVTARVIGFNQNNASVVIDFTAASGTLTFNNAVSEKGMVVTLPTNNSAADGTGATITFREADREDDLNLGRSFTVTITNTSNDQFHVSAHNLTSFDEEDSNDHFIGYVPSDLASKITFDTSADENDFTIEYFGDEVTADVQVVAGGTVSTGTGVLGDVIVTDAEVSSVSTKNLVVVGGSCINSAAAALVGSAYCGSAWTTATGVGAGQFLIKGYASSSITSRMALLVAGYEAADTTNAATYLRTQSVDTSKSYKGTSATQATLVVA